MSILSRLYRGEVLPWVALFISVDALSFLGHYFPILAPWSFVLVLGLFTIVSLANYPLAVALAFAELFLGSQGQLFSISVVGFPVSLRLGIFLILFVAGLWAARKLPRDNSVWRQIFERKWFVLLGAVVAFAFLNGYMAGYGLRAIFFDANAYLFIGFILPLFIASRTEGFFSLVVRALFIAAGYLSVKTLLALSVFTHISLAGFVPDFYTWLRDVRIAELTRAPGGAWRIFMQSQLYLLVAWWIAFIPTLKKPLWVEWRRVGYLGLIAAGLVISFSRSFWLGWAMSIAAVGLWLLVTKQWVNIVRSIGVAATALGIGALLIYAAINIQVPGRGVDTKARLDVAARLIGEGEAAVSSRWNLLGPLWTAVQERPILGSGFGSAVTYISDDPRVRAENPTGEYTTTAFEWGYLDQWLKLGIVGLVALGGIVFAVFKSAWRYGHWSTATIGLVAGLVAILGTHVGSPYLNHPLGLGWLLFLLVLFANTKHLNSLTNRSG